MYVIIRPNFVNLLEDPNSLHEQFYTSPFVISIELNLDNRGYFGNLLFQPTQSKTPGNLLNQMGKVLNLQGTTHKM